MGNHMSCTFSAGCGPSPASGGGSRAVRVILPSGEVQRIDGPANAAELMLDHPGHFLVNSCSMQVGRRFSALAADEDLEMGHVYVTMPMKKLNSVIAADDMSRLVLAASGQVRRASAGKSRVLPESSSSPENKLAGPRLDEAEAVADATTATLLEMGEFKYRLSMCRSRKPTLETIAEEGIFSR